ncbi:MAG: outer membrane protein assembly factor BamC [Burkholderiaceae bacterium]
MRSDLKRFLPAAAVLLLLASGLSGCSTSLMSDDSIDYKSAGKRAPLDIPPDLLDPATGTAAGRRGPSGDTTLSDYRRERGAADAQKGPKSLLPAVAGVELSRAGSQRFLTVDLPAADVWPVLREFWLDSGFLIAREAPELGLVETDWAENRAKVPDDAFRNTVGRFLDTLYSTGERDKFRSRIETVNGKTEVYISHRGLVEVYSDELKEKPAGSPGRPIPTSRSSSCVG